MLYALSSSVVFDHAKLFPHQMWYRVDNPLVYGKTIRELGIRKLTGSSIVALRRVSGIIWVHDASVPLVKGDEILVYGTRDELASFERAFALTRLHRKARTVNERMLAQIA